MQAAIGAVALDTARKMNNVEGEELGKQILTLAVLSIIITAPIGAAAIAISGPHLLKLSDRATETVYTVDENGTTEEQG